MLMDFRIADTFTDSLARLTGDEQKAAKTTAFDLQVDPSNPGLSFHRLDKARDKHFWSVRVSGDIRIILHKDGESTLLAYVDHHDAAYQWAERKRVVIHERTGAMQYVEVPVVAAAEPWRAMLGWPCGERRTSISCMLASAPMPEPKALATASLAAQRAAKEGWGWRRESQ